MQTDRSTDPRTDRPDFPDVCIATGYTVTIRTKYGHLRVEDENAEGRRPANRGNNDHEKYSRQRTGPTDWPLAALQYRVHGANHEGSNDCGL